MTFAANKELAKVAVTTLVRLRPRRRLTGWVEGDPGIWRRSWSDNVVGILIDSRTEYLDEESSEAACLSNPDSFFYDAANEEIILNLSTDDPNVNFVAVEWDVRVATRDLNWFQNPTDAGSGDAHWSGGIVQAPSPSQGNPDLIFGYSPIQITSLQIQVADGFLFEHLHDWSLSGSPIKVWLCVGELDTQNISELFVGVGGSVRMEAGILQIDVQDPLRLLDADYSGDTYDLDDFPALTPGEAGLPIREVFGYLSSFLPVNIDYDATPATNNNRNWAVSKGPMADSAARTFAISSAPSGTSTVLTDASYIRVGDSIVIEDGGVDKYASVTSVDLGTDTIGHTDIGSRSFTPGDDVRRGFITHAFVRVDNTDYPLKYGRDWAEQDFASNTKGLVLTDDFEANLISDGYSDFPTVFNPALHTLWVGVYGNAVLPKKLDNTTNFGALTATGGTAGHPVVILWDMLRNRVPNFREVVLLDETSWQALALSFDRSIGLAIPEQKTGAFPTWAQVAQLLLQTEIMSMHFKVANGLSTLMITQAELAQSGGREVTEFEITDPSYFWDTSDVYSRLQMEINTGEVFPGSYRILDPTTVYVYADTTVELSPLRAASYLHRVDKTFSFRSLFSSVLNDESDLVALRLAKIIGERRGTISARLPIGFLDKSIDDDISVELKRLTGFPVTDQTRTREYKLAQHTKSAEGVNVILDDQKGIQDSGRWE